MRIVDTSFLYALFNANDKYHAAAKHAIVEKGPITVPIEVWSETIGVMQRRLGFEATLAVKRWLGLRNNVRLGFSADREQRHAWTHYERREGELSLVDAVGIAWARLKSAELLTFDERQRTALTELS